MITFSHTEVSQAIEATRGVVEKELMKSMMGTPNEIMQGSLNLARELFNEACDNMQRAFDLIATDQLKLMVAQQSPHVTLKVKDAYEEQNVPANFTETNNPEVD